MNPSSAVLKDQPTTPPAVNQFGIAVERSLKIGAACGTAGFIVGGAAGIVKFGAITNATTAPFLFATASGIQTFAIGTAFWGVRSGIVHAWTPDLASPTARDLTYASTISGGVTGGAMAALFRGRSHVLPGAVMFTLFGFLGQTTYNKLAASSYVDTGPKKGFWARVAERKWSPMKVLSNEEYAEMLRERQLKIDMEIALIDDKIAALRTEQEEPVPVSEEASAQRD